MGRNILNSDNHIMVDIETLGNKSSSAIVSISMVRFNPRTCNYINEFDCKCDIDTIPFADLHIDGSTVKWWLQQSEKARESFTSGKAKYFSMLLAATRYLQKNKDCYVWGNSARFDLGILQDSLYKYISKELPWDFRKELDVRTIVVLDPEVKFNHKFFGVYHDGIDDCKNQIKYLSDTLHKIGYYGNIKD